MNLPYEGERYRASKRRFEETIVFVPFFNGKKEQLKRHVEFVSNLGFDSAILENSIPKGPVSLKKLFAKNGKWGVKHVWADEIENFLNLIEGPKIIFAFSGPSSCAIEAVARRPKANGNLDVIALICDSGPFFYDRYCNRNRLFLEQGITNPLKLAFTATLHEKIWSRNHEKSLSEDLASLPQSFPILSIRALEDKLVPPWAIDAAFRDQRHLDLEVFDVPGAEHLKGLRDFPEVYKPIASRFLEKKGRLI